jgi:SSS family solute:Na+ symporter
MAELVMLDYVLIAVYVAALLAVGYFSSRGQRDEDYLIADRKLGVLSTAATINASKTGAILMTFVSFVYVWGFSSVWYFIGMFLGILLFLPFGLRLRNNSKNKFYTLADYFRCNYGIKSAYFASGLSVFMMFGFFVINLIAGVKLFSFFSGWNFVICAVITMGVVLAYLLMGGFKAVVKTDFIQYVSIVAIMILLIFVLLGDVSIPVSEWNFSEAGLVNVIGFFLVGIFFPFAMPELWQRTYSSKSDKVFVNGLLLSSFVYLVFGVCLAFLALIVKVSFPVIDPDLALVYGFANLLPSGLVGLGVVMLFAAIMSSLDTYVFTGSSAIVQDFFGWNKRRAVEGMRGVMFVFSLLGMVVAVFIQSLIVSSYIFVAVVVVLAVCVLATWISRKVDETVLLWGFVVGIFGFVVFMVATIENISPSIVGVVLFSVLLGLGAGKIVSKFGG